MPIIYLGCWQKSRNACLNFLAPANVLRIYFEKAEKHMEEVIIIGSGCAGMGAAIYCARAGMRPLVLEGSQPGGLLTTTSDVENFPGFPEAVNGFDLVWRMREQAQKFGARIETAIIEKSDLSAPEKKLYSNDGREFCASKVIIATGSSPRMTGVPGEAELYGGKGVSACATCDGAFYRDKDVVVIGGGDTACEEAVFLTRFCKSVKIIHRRNEFRASKIMAERALSNPKIEAVWDSVAEEILKGDDGFCRGVKVKNVKTQAVSEIPCKGVFIAIGHVPNTAAFKGELEMDSEGYIKHLPDSLVKTNIENVYVAGDCSDKVFRQAITASAMGCMAGILASS